MKTFFEGLKLSFLFLCIGSFSKANVIYVNHLASGADNGTSWTNAYVKLQNAITNSIANDTIWVASGTYYPDEGIGYTNNDKTHSFSLKNGVVIYGGFNGTETFYLQRNWSTNICILSGNIDQTSDSLNNANNVVYCSAVNNTAVLDGFTIREGYNTTLFRAGGIYCTSSSPRFENLIVEFNYSSVNTSTFVAFAGGGIFLNASSPTMKNCTVKNNYSYADCSWSSTSQCAGAVGGLFLYGASAPTIIKIVVENNTAVAKHTASGFSGYQGATATGGIWCYESGCNPRIINAVITGNTGEALIGDYNTGVGGVNADYNSQPKLTNVIIANNTGNAIGADYAMATGGAHSGYTSGTFLNGSTIFGNNASASGINSYAGGGYFAFVTGGTYTPTNANTVIYGNTASGAVVNHQDFASWNTNTPVFKNCLFQSYTGGTACIIGNPDFNNPSDLNGPDDTWFTSDDGLHIGCGSDAIDNGDSTIFSTDATDIDADLNTTELFPYDIRNKDRVRLTKLDIGAYEFQISSQLAITSCGNYTSPSGNILSASGTYTDCVVDTSYTITLSVSTLNDYAFTAPILTFCSGDSSAISSTNSELNVNYWLRDDSDNSIIDGPVAGTGSGISFNTGAVNATTTYNVYATKNIGAIDLPANNDYVKLNTPFYAYGNEITIESWVNFNGTAQPWAGQSSENADNMAQNVWLWHAGTFYVNYSGTWRALNFPTVTSTGWKHVTTVANPACISIYYDGVLVAYDSTGFAGTVQNNSSSVIFIGQDPRYPTATGRNSNHSFDNFTVWNTTRTQAQVLSDMNACPDGTETNLVQNTKFNQNSGTLVYADKGANGTIINAAGNWVSGSGVCDIVCDLQMTDMITLTVIQPTSSTQTITSCENYTWNGNTFTSSGTYLDTLVNVNGCDSLMTLNLTVIQPTTSTQTITACENYTWNGNTFTTSGNYLDTLINASGCDSLMTLNLTIVQPTSSTETITACESYTWNGNTFTSSGTYLDTLVNVNGCDSLMTLNLTINTVNTGVTNTAPTLTAIASGERTSGWTAIIISVLSAVKPARVLQLLSMGIMR